MFDLLFFQLGCLANALAFIGRTFDICMNYVKMFLYIDSDYNCDLELHV